MKFLLFSVFLVHFCLGHYGKHFPFGKFGVDHLYGPLGTFKEVYPLNYKWNYYQQYSTPNHPFNKEQVIIFANGKNTHTCRDANGLLLHDRNHQGNIDPNARGSAFHEHNAIGLNGEKKGNAFTQFWFDDNWLARYMSIAWEKPHPVGLNDYEGFMRWRIMGLDNRLWRTYNSNFFDTLALDGLYFISRNDYNSALRKYNEILTRSGNIFNRDIQQYEYIRIHENYHLGLFGILTTFLMDHFQNDKSLIQHFISIRSNVILYQEKREGVPIGWRSDRTQPNSLINTESTAIGVMALATNCQFAFEAGREPLQSNSNNYFLRPYNAYSAVVGQSREGFMIFGPYIELGRYNWEIQFFLRSPGCSNPNLGWIDVAINGNSLFRRDLLNSDFSQNEWKNIKLNFESSENQKYEFRLYWSGQCNLDASLIRLKRK